MRAQAAEITISSVAARARVHRSFIHRHPDLRAAVIAAAEDPAASGPAAASAVSRRSLLADNANLRDRARRLEQHARSLEDRLSELLGTQISQRTGLSPLRQENLDLRHRTEERDEELAAAREANRRLMTEVNKARSLAGPRQGREIRLPRAPAPQYPLSRSGTGRGTTS